MGLMSVGGVTKKLLATYDVSQPQDGITFRMYDTRYKYLLVVYVGYSGNDPKNQAHACFIFANVDGVNPENAQQGALSERYGSSGSYEEGVIRSRKCQYNQDTNSLIFWNPGRYSPTDGWKIDNRVCPVAEIWGIN